MSQMLGKERIERTELPPLLVRSRALDYTLIAIGAVVAAFGVYTNFAPTEWLWADLAEAWHLGSWAIGGALLAGGLGLLGAGMRDEDGHWTTRAIATFVLGAVALAGAVTFAVVWIV